MGICIEAGRAVNVATLLRSCESLPGAYCPTTARSPKSSALRAGVPQPGTNPLLDQRPARIPPSLDNLKHQPAGRLLRSRLSLKLTKAAPRTASSARALTRCFRDLPKRSLSVANSTPSLVRASIRSPLTLQNLHHEEELTLLLGELMDRADIGMVERQGRPRFAFEALQRLRITPCGASTAAQARAPQAPQSSTVQTRSTTGSWDYGAGGTAAGSIGAASPAYGSAQIGGCIGSSSEPNPAYQGAQPLTRGDTLGFGQ